MLVLLAGFAAGLGRPRLALGGHSGAAPDVFTLGLVTSSDERLASTALSARRAVEIVVDEINAAGGIRGWPIRLIEYEAGADATISQGIAQRFDVDDRVVGIVSVLSPSAIRAAQPGLAKSRIPLIETLEADPDITRAGPCIFRNRPLAIVEGRAGAEVAVVHRRARRIAILTRDDELARATSAAFAQHATMRGASIPAQPVYGTNEHEFSRHLRPLLAGRYDLIYHVSDAEDGARLTRAARALGIDVPLLGTARLDSMRFLAAAGAAAEGTMFTTTFNPDDPRPDIQRFLATYRERTAASPDMVAANAYDAARALIRVATYGGAERCSLLARLERFPSVSGTLHRFVGGEAVKSVQVQVVRDGQARWFASVDAPAIITP